MIKFYKFNWEAVKGDVVKLVVVFCEKARLTKACTSSFNPLIPKVKNLQFLTEFRPICLVGSLYKIVTKLLATRLKGVIGKLSLQIKRHLSRGDVFLMDFL